MCGGSDINKKEQALSMRIKGYSYNEINKELGIPKSTLSGWFSNLALSPKAQQRIQSRVSQGVMNGLVKRNKKQTHLAWQRARKTQKEASRDINKISKRDLLIIGVALYWGEGYKKLKVIKGKERTSHAISFTNTDPEMIKLFILFLEKVMEIPKSKMRASLRLFKDNNEEETLVYWCSVTGLSKESFQKPIYVISRSSQGKRPYNRLPYGTIQILVSDTSKFHKIIGWIGGMKSCIIA